MVTLLVEEKQQLPAIAHCVLLMLSLEQLHQSALQLSSMPVMPEITGNLTWGASNGPHYTASTEVNTCFRDCEWWFQPLLFYAQQKTNCRQAKYADLSSALVCWPGNHMKSRAGM